MFTLRFVSLFLLASTSLVAASPAPVAQPEPVAVAAVEKRQSTSSIEGVLTTLQSSLSAPLGDIMSLSKGGNATDANLAPLIENVVDALNTASSSMSGLSSSRKRQSDSDIASLVAGIVTDITDALSGLLGEASSIPDLGTYLGSIDAALSQVLNGLETLLAGVLTLVADLLVDVAGLLEQLALGLTLASLGL
ncbi:hypothetical protein HMN09_01104200 [Mycena chlorophos]|uniref:Sc15 protein n=1 Tax=Mycena chlorophos TaxID=658473 RepID=A0A8H6VYC8_MYCCL|nr:hypothetical protein HMN09_01104200 [Mycena chlorophos]